MSAPAVPRCPACGGPVRAVEPQSLRYRIGYAEALDALGEDAVVAGTAWTCESWTCDSYGVEPVAL